MTYEQFEKEIVKLYREKSDGTEMVIMARHKYDFEAEYSRFEIILSENEDGRIEVDWDYDEGEDDYIIDGWVILDRLLERVHNLILVIPEGLRWI